MRGMRGAWARACALVMLVLGLVVAPVAGAVVRDVEPGSTPVLRDGDALLLISVDTDVDLEFVRISRAGVGLGETRTLRGVKKGVSARLYVVPAGRYRWSTVGIDGEYRLSRDPEFGFDVKAGVINYPGDLVFRETGWRTAYVHVSNRGLQAMDWLDATHPALAAAVTFQHSGRYEDPFPAYYRNLARGAVAPSRSAPEPVAASLPLAVPALWAPGRVRRIELNPAGDLIAEVVRYPSPEDPKADKAGNRITWAVNLIDLDSNKVVRLFEAPVPVQRLDWVGDRTIVMSFARGSDPRSVVAGNIEDGPSGRTYRTVVVPRRGWVVATPVDRPGHILFASREDDDLLVHALDVRSQEAVLQQDFRRSRRLNDDYEDAETLFVDGTGAIRMAIAHDAQGRHVLRHGPPGAIRDVMVLDGESDFTPLALSGDGTRVWGLAEEGRGQQELVELDPATGAITRTVFRVPGRDIIDALVSPDGRLLGAQYVRDGLVVNEYFAQDDAALQKRFGRAFPGKAVSIIQRNADRSRMLLLVSGSDQPGQLYYFDAATSEAALVSETAPWLSGMTFASSTALQVPTADGHVIEAFLTLPRGATGRVPLVVMPHGGPVGVTDLRYFDPEVQLVASLGYAVLQVNFRGSDGYGTAFRDAGRRNLGQGIEDDIDAAVAEALKQFPIDPARMCVLGGSHGGYSAMITTVRHPTRYRCAVSLAGVSDLPLMFTASDAARSDDGRQGLVNTFGDPATELKRLMETSPVYRHEAMTTPLMLVHGTDDFRVDYEHARRIARLLTLAGRPPVTLTLEGEGHTIDDDAARERAWSAIAAFLRQHLDGNAPSTPTTAR